jgi:hypothetical protein
MPISNRTQGIFLLILTGTCKLIRSTAASFGVSVNTDNAANNNHTATAPIRFSEQMDFDQMLAGWIPLTCALNYINQGMGLPDLYPFVISPDVIEKLNFIHQVINPAPPAK